MKNTPPAAKPAGQQVCRPRARGDASCTTSMESWSQRSAPRTRGCFLPLRAGGVGPRVGPAHAGMLLRNGASHLPVPRRPRARGDASHLGAVLRQARSSAPRTRGCFPPSAWTPAAIRSAPRTRGCFPPKHHPRSHPAVGPAHAGMLPARTHRATHPRRRPRARGDASQAGSGWFSRLRSAPRTRGCFPLGTAKVLSRSVGPAHAGMLLCTTTCTTGAWSRPRARGDASHGPRRRRARTWSAPRTRGCFAVYAGHYTFSEVGPAHAGMLRRVPE